MCKAWIPELGNRANETESGRALGERLWRAAGRPQARERRQGWFQAAINGDEKASRRMGSLLEGLRGRFSGETTDGQRSGWGIDVAPCRGGAPLRMLGKEQSGCSQDSRRDRG